MEALIRWLRPGPTAGRQSVLPPARSFFVIFIPAAILLTSAFAIWQRMDVGQQLAKLEVNEAARVRLAADLMAHSLDDAAADLMLLASSPCLHRFVDKYARADLRCVESLFADMVREKQIYDQARFLDAGGMEIVRVNLSGNGADIVPANKLQPKGERYFFRDTISLGNRDIYVSPLDLNIEHGQIEVPHKPMLRIGTPIVGESGEKRGAVILNLFGSTLLTMFREAMTGSPQPMLLNRDGYWLSHPQADKAWGFMFGHPGSMAVEAPGDWHRLNASESGSYVSRAGIYSFTTVHPLQAGQRSSTGSPLARGESAKQLADADYFWKVVSFVPVEALPTAGLFDTPRRIAWLFAGWALLALVVAPIARNNDSRRRLRLVLEEDERQLRDITSTLDEGLFLLDEAGRIVFANPAAERLLGRSKAELVGQSAHRLFHNHREDGQTLSEDECPIQRAQGSGRCYRGEGEVIWGRSGEPFPVEVNACTLMREGHPAGVVVAFQDISERWHAQAKIRELAFHDAVTGLPNRRLLLDRLNQALAQTNRHPHFLALLFIDLDGFKDVNDSLGHAAGDELLSVIARRIESVVRTSDTVGRLGGDEFVVLLPELAEAGDAGDVAKKVLSACSEPVVMRGRLTTVSASIGIAVSPGDGNDDAVELMRKADQAMYDAKDAGRNTFQYYAANRLNTTSQTP
ncbi:MAG: diguanylate cyclase [Gammaproteobacteria bacterium]|nr:diguanylate cyclase [Gammaproteobacteria bacterium]MBU1414522.1 diguanylate cyclase [Gammaproteobacteria bacterium]